MMSIDEIRSIREQYWNLHPIVRRKLILPTKEIKKWIKKADSIAYAHRDCMALWGHPDVGKTHCARVLKNHLRNTYRNAGVVFLDAKDTSTGGEVTFWVGVLGDAMGYQGPIPSQLGKLRTKVYRAMYALAVESMRLFLIIDEAQALKQMEWRWLKSALNYLGHHGVDVVVFTFGQFDLVNSVKDLKSSVRPDLHARFGWNTKEYRGARSSADLTMPLNACDSDSEFPEGSGISYTQFLLPSAFASGYRIADQREEIWRAMAEAGFGYNVGMGSFTRVLKCFAVRVKTLDRPGFLPSYPDWVAAARASVPDDLEATLPAAASVATHLRSKDVK